MTVLTYDPWAQKVRLELLASAGAQVCLIGRTKARPGCQVITQGGPDGLKAHRQRCHYSDQRIERP